MANEMKMQGRNFNEMLLFRQAVWTSRHLMITCRNLNFYDHAGYAFMSLNTSQASDALSAKDVEQIAILSRLAVDPAKAAAHAEGLNKILSLMQTLQSIDTTDIEPLKSPFDHAQPLRDDVVSETNQRDQYQAIAPATQDGLYLVPRVIE